ncbi:hypothetical protein LBMAG53_29590 [Planctomycetota bacterium]|nr:hypothetical protein LBMAG53_29590 [Planctomycetota bacterium]
MRTFLFLLVLAGIGAGLYWFGYLPGRTAPTPVAAVAPDGPPSLSGTPTLSPNPASVPAAVQAEHDQAEALWAAGGEHPATSAKAPRMAVLYTTVLKALYNRPGQQALEEKLVAERLTPLGDALFFSKARFPEDDTGIFALYSVEPGDSPDRIAKKFGMSAGLVNRLRGAEPNASHLQAGETLKVVKVVEKGGYRIHVDKSDFHLDVFIAGLFARRYQVSHGAADSPTPVGTTTVVKRELNPSEWKDPKTGRVIPSTDPDFILGPVWIAFDNATFPRPGIGIHGYTGANGGMGRQVSNGCVRMLNDQVVELFHTLASPERATTTVEVVD